MLMILSMLTTWEKAFAMSLKSHFLSSIYNLGCGTPVSVEVCKTVELLISGKSELTDVLKDRTSGQFKILVFM